MFLIRHPRLILYSTSVDMEKSDIFNVVFLFILNIFFLVAGIFFNSVVIISLWRLRQLRKKLCYFVILVLSCFDVAVVAITHPFLITSTIYYCLEDVNEIREYIRKFLSFILYGFSMSALLILNVERYLALTCPFFHQASITKRRLLYAQVLFIVATGILPMVHFKDQTVGNILIAVFQSLLLVLFISSNYRLFLIANSKLGDERAAPIAATSAGNDNRNTRILNLKNISTCSLAIGCFFACSCPQMVYSVLRFVLEVQPYDRQIWLFNLWSSTFLSMNSTFNCLIFFWRNSILRREGKKFIDAFQRHFN